MVLEIPPNNGSHNHFSIILGQPMRASRERARWWLWKDHKYLGVHFTIPSLKILNEKICYLKVLFSLKNKIVKFTRGCSALTLEEPEEAGTEGRGDHAVGQLPQEELQQTGG